MQLTKFVLLFFFILSVTVSAQRTITAKLIDSTTQNTIPFATISLDDNTGVISNEKGMFNIRIKKKVTEMDSLYFSCLGYEKKQISIQNFTDSIVVLQPKIIDLSEVLITNKNYSIDEIIEKIKTNLDNNYDKNYNKRKLFFRESFYTNLLKGDVKIKKTTIPEFNQEFVDSIMVAVPKNTDEYLEILGELYGEIDKSAPQKMNIIKASHLYDKKNEITFENYENRFNEIIKKHVKRDSYFKIKSGLFGTKEDIDSTFFDDPAEKETAAFIEEKKRKRKRT